MRHALVTGGAGFIGSHLAEALLAKGYRVTTLDDLSAGSEENLHTVRNHFDFTFVKGSATDRELLRRLLADVDDVYHLAAAVGVGQIARDPVETIERNVRPAQILFAELLKCLGAGRRVKLFVASSSEVYGKNPNDCWDEAEHLLLGATSQPRWSYGAAKALVEYLVMAYWRQYQLPVVVARLFNVVGPRQSGRYGMVLPRFVDQALAGKPPIVYDDGQQIRCFAHVADICNAVVKLMETDAAIGQVVNVGSDQPVTILGLAERVVAAVNPELDIEFESYRNVYGNDFEDIRRRVPNIEKLKKTIHHQPAQDLDTIIREIIDWKKGLA